MCEEGGGVGEGGRGHLQTLQHRQPTHQKLFINLVCFVCVRCDPVPLHHILEYIFWANLSLILWFIYLGSFRFVRIPGSNVEPLVCLDELPTLQTNTRMYIYIFRTFHACSQDNATNNATNWPSRQTAACHQWGSETFPVVLPRTLRAGWINDNS